MTPGSRVPTTIMDAPIESAASDKARAGSPAMVPECPTNPTVRQSFGQVSPHLLGGLFHVAEVAVGIDRKQNPGPIRQGLLIGGDVHVYANQIHPKAGGQDGSPLHHGRQLPRYHPD